MKKAPEHGKARLLFMAQLDYDEQAGTYKLTEQGAMVGYQKEHSISSSTDTDIEKYKGYTDATVSDVEYEISATFLAADDLKYEAWKKHHEEGKPFALWSLHTGKKQESKYYSDFYIATATSWEESYPSDGKIETSIDFSVVERDRGYTAAPDFAADLVKTGFMNMMSKTTTPKEGGR